MAIAKRSAAVFVCLFSSTLFAGFASTEAYLPSVGRLPGKNGAQFYTTIWATNLTSAPQTFTFQFLKAGQSNPSPASFEDALQPGQTKVYENVVETKLGLTNALGAARITSSGEIFVSERIYNQEPGDDLGKTEGLFFAGVPKSFSISAGQSASIQGVDQGSSEDFRYNFALVETGGGSADVNVQVYDGNGTLLGQHSFPLSPYEQIQPSVADVVSSIATTNARITATVTDGDGSVLLAGAQVANESQDSSGFEMTFRDELLGGSSGGGGLTSVIHDSTLVGSGTAASPLGVNPADVVRSVNDLHGTVTLAAGSNVTITPSGSTLTIASAGGGGGGFTLPFAGSTNTTNPSFAVSNAGFGMAIEATSNASNVSPAQNPFAIKGVSTGTNGTGVYGTTGGASGETGWTGVWGDSHDATAVTGTSFKDRGVLGITSGIGSSVAGVEGLNRDTNGIGILGRTGAGNSFDPGIYPTGVMGDSPGNGVVGIGDELGVYGEGKSGAGVSASSLSSNGVVAVSHSSTAILGYTLATTAAGVEGDNDSFSTKGYLGGDDYGVFAHGAIVTDGTKDFVEPHPTDPTKQILYVCLEGRESGTYFRGTGRVVNGFATIDVPEDFRFVTSPEGLTVQLTPVGDLAVLAVVSEDLARIVVRGSSDVEFHYMVNGVRKAFEDHRPIVENRFFVPKSRDDDFARALPAESVRRLIANGTINPDGTINLATAHRLGWDRQESWKRADENRIPPKN